MSQSGSRRQHVMPDPKLMSLAGAELAVGADAEGDGVGLFLDDVGGLLVERDVDATVMC
ncbi:hypothetical protein ACNPQM_21445 [Streptomyces sp. NPDC056231]|uniref:hypothetical protein n=1 Tax=Streptomyces sp. NPDC056231 TaxID=3345755 RepID=UPI003AB0F879